MSAANDPYDPKQVAALGPEALEAGVRKAEKAFAEAADLDALARAKPAHLGDRSPLRLARREIAGLPPHARADAGRRLNDAFAAVQAAYDGRLAALTTERDERVLSEETVDVTLPWDRVPAGARHAYRNTGDEIAHIVCHARPPSSLQEFLEDTAALSRAGKITRHGVPKGPSALLLGAVLAHHYRDMVVLGFPPMPPPLLQRLLFPALARLGERRGYQAGRFSEIN